MRGRACRNCFYIVPKGTICPNCKGNSFSPRWNGLLVILDPSKSTIAKKLMIKSRGKYALSVT
jgi:RNA polymerase subunit RPABC4/transcription elongation factor Spt4